MLGIIEPWRLSPLVLLISTAIAYATLPPAPIYRFAFDVGRADNEIDEQITIPEHRSYIFGIQFDYYNEVDLHRVENLVGIGLHTKLHGIFLPLTLKLVKILDDDSEQLIYENTRVTEGTWRRESSPEKRFAGYFIRPIVTIGLQPGLYRLHLKTVQSTIEFSGTPTYLVVDYHPEIRFIPNDP